MYSYSYTDILNTLNLKHPAVFEEAMFAQTGKIGAGATTRSQILVCLYILQNPNCPVHYVAPPDCRSSLEFYLEALKRKPWIENYSYAFHKPTSYALLMQSVQNWSGLVVLDHRWEISGNTDNRLNGPYAEITSVDVDNRAFDVDGNFVLQLAQNGLRDLHYRNPIIFPKRDGFVRDMLPHPIPSRSTASTKSIGLPEDRRSYQEHVVNHVATQKCNPSFP